MVNFITKIIFNSINTIKIPNNFSFYFDRKTERKDTTIFEDTKRILDFALLFKSYIFCGEINVNSDYTSPLKSIRLEIGIFKTCFFGEIVNNLL